MTDHVPVTDEELTELMDWVLVMAGAARWDDKAVSLATRQMHRLITDLRAARERIKELEDGIEAFLSGRNPL